MRRKSAWCSGFSGPPRRDADVEIGYLTARGRVRFMADEDTLRIGITNQKPRSPLGLL